MTAATPKPSRFWGTTPRRVKSLILILFVLLTGAGLLIGNLLFRDFIWKFNATDFAAQAACADAKMYYAHGSRRLLEIATIDESKDGRVPTMFEMDPTGRQLDGFEIYSYYVTSSGGAPERITAESYVKAFNHWMRTICANPDWFGPNGERIPESAGMNRPPFKRIPE